MLPSNTVSTTCDRMRPKLQDLTSWIVVFTSHRRITPLRSWHSSRPIRVNMCSSYLPSPHGGSSPTLGLSRYSHDISFINPSQLLEIPAAGAPTRFLGRERSPMSHRDCHSASNCVPKSWRSWSVASSRLPPKNSTSTPPGIRQSPLSLATPAQHFSTGKLHRAAHLCSYRLGVTMQRTTYVQDCLEPVL